MYRRLVKGLNQVGKMIPANDDIYKHIDSFDNDYYLSIYLYNEEQKKKADEVIDAEYVDRTTGEVKRYKRNRGVKNVENVVTNLLAFDLDSKRDLEQARKDTVTVCERLHSLGIPYEQQNISFSGGKGFSVVVVHDSQLTPTEHKQIAKEIAGDLKSFDTTLYNASRIFRINNTKHPETGLYKTPLNFEDLKSVTIEEIKDAAKHQYEIEPLIETKLPEKILNILKSETTKEVTKVEDTSDFYIDFKKKPFFFTDVKYALHCGYIPEGYGNTGMMILCSTYKHLGYSKEDAYYALKAVNEKRSSIYNIPKRPKEDIWNQIINVVYSPAWNGGTFGKENELIQKTIETFGITEGSRIETFDGMLNDFFDFAKNINENIVKTGIESLDNNVLITTGMMVGILGAPSSGKCLGKGTKIRMYDGSVKKVEDVVPGDLLMGDNLEPRKVLSCCSGTEMLYKVNQKYGADYIVNESHILSLVNNGDVIDIDIKSYNKKDSKFKENYKGYVAYSIYPKKDLKIDPYRVGLYLASSYDSSNLTEEECMVLKEYNMLDKTHIDSDFLINDKETRVSLLRGIYDACAIYHETVNLEHVFELKESLQNDVLMLIRSLGYQAYIGNDGNAHFSIYEDASETPIVVEQLEVGEYYGFEIDGNRRFLLEDYTVTHNTALTTSIIENHAKSGMKPLFCSLDMTKHLLSMRLLQRESGISTESKLRKMMKEDPDYDPTYDFKSDEQIKQSVENLSKIYKNVSFNFTRGATIESIEEDIKANKIKYGEQFKLVVVDYLEKVRGPYSDSTANSGYVASRLSDLASTYNVAIILLLQPQKSAGDPSEPLLSMRKVKGASVIEQDCRVILTLWREGFNPQSFEKDKFASIAIVKNNMGAVKTLDFKWNGLKGELSELKIREREELERLREAKAEAKAEENSNWGI